MYYCMIQDLKLFEFYINFWVENVFVSGVNSLNFFSLKSLRSNESKYDSINYTGVQIIDRFIR